MNRHSVIYNNQNLPNEREFNRIVNFLFKHLDQFGDPAKDIAKAMNYSLSNQEAKGGLILTEYDDDEIIGAVVINNTGMEDYIPEHILVYIAVHKDYRGKGIGKKLMKQIIDITTGDIALHVEPNNPAKFLYEKVGYTNKYLEMRYKRKDV